MRAAGPPLPDGERSDRIGRCDPGEGLQSHRAQRPLTRIALDDASHRQAQSDLSPSGRGEPSSAPARFYAALVVTSVAIGNPCSIGSDGSRDHSFQEPKYIRTSFTPAFLSARKVFEARAPLKQ